MNKIAIKMYIFTTSKKRNSILRAKNANRCKFVLNAFCEYIYFENEGEEISLDTK